jgi:TolB-like protein/Tfp pilus assembly protein PilF/predicted Ser/Thr protein kinase
MRIAPVTRFCRKCGAAIPPASPQQSCGACLLETALDPIEPEDEMSPDLALSSVLMEFGDYELLEQIGRGGQGVVFRARQKSLNRTVALKVISLGQWASKAHVKRFRQEAEAAASLEHPGIVPIHEVGERDGSCYFSMKFVEGGQLDEVVRRTPMSIRHAVELIAKLARIVHYAHERGILHRDIKPGNILLDQKGEPHLTDFGLARLIETESTMTRTMEVLGTPSYMAPEQAAGNNAAVNCATDVYGLGAVLYHLLTGQPPFAGGTTYETTKLLLETEPRPPRQLNPKVDRDLSTVCLKCLEKDPKGRYSSALALAEDLERWLKHEPISARHTGIAGRSKRWVRRNPTNALLTAALLVLAAVVGWNIWKSELLRPPLTTGIAVLPFEDLSEQKEQGAFADGVQDDILSKLATIAALKVISRTSVMDYRGKRNIREIGNELRVSHVLEGSVRKIGTHLRLNAQLIDTRTALHVWVGQYDRDLNELFAIQSEIARTVAERLKAKVTAGERLAIEQKPTQDLAAFELYSLANNIFLRATPGKSEESIDLLTQAIVRDPSFFQAYLLLARVHEDLYRYGYDHTPARLAMSVAAVQEASRLRPDAGETHLARQVQLYVVGDYAGALAGLETAERKLPNDPRVFSVKASIQRRQSKWEESTRNFQRAIELDPRNWRRLRQLGFSYLSLRRYADQQSMLDRALAIEPNNLDLKAERAMLELKWKADTRPLHQVLDSIRGTNPGTMPNISGSFLACALAERDPAAAQEALSRLGESTFDFETVHFTPRFMEGLIARMTNDDHKAQLAFAAARAEQEKVVEAQPDYAPALAVLGLIDAALGRKEEALRAGRRAVELLPVEKDAGNGQLMIQCFAIIAAWAGEKDLACEQLARALRYPNTPTSAVSYGDLKLTPWWDPLRSEPCFDELLEEARKPLAPKSE